MAVREYFLGGNTRHGFFSCYSNFCRPEDGDFLWVIKGGPGCGKSSFMRKIGKAAETAGLDVEYVRCSGDPESLDGVYIPAWKVGWVDGTAPHVLDVPYPAACGMYLDLGRFYDVAALREKAQEIRRICAAYRVLYADAYKCLAAASQEAESAEAMLPAARRRFLRAVSCAGIVSLPAYAKQTQHVSQGELREIAADEDAIYVLDPLRPHLLDAIITNGVCYDATRPLPDCEKAIRLLQDAKALHDELEAIYNPHVDFSGVYAEAERHIARYSQNEPCIAAENDVK